MNDYPMDTDMDDWGEDKEWEDLPDLPDLSKSEKIDIKHEIKLEQKWKPLHRIFSTFFDNSCGLPWFKVVSFLRDHDVLKLVARTSKLLNKQLTRHVRLSNFTRNLVPKWTFVCDRHITLEVQ